MSYYVQCFGLHSLIIREVIIQSAVWRGKRRLTMDPTIIECLDCGEEVAYEDIEYTPEGKEYIYPDNCPECGESLDYPSVDEREDFCRGT